MLSLLLAHQTVSQSYSHTVYIGLSALCLYECDLSLVRCPIFKKKHFNLQLMFYSSISMISSPEILNSCSTLNEGLM